MSFSSPSSDFVLLATTDASSSASVSFDGYFSATYKNYVVFYSSVLPATAGTKFTMRTRVSNANVTSNYYSAVANTRINAVDTLSMDLKGSYDESSALISAENIKGTQGISGFINIYDPLNTSIYKKFTGQNTHERNDAGYFYSNHFGVQNNNSTSALSGINFLFSSGNITSGNFKLYGIK